MLWNFLTLEMCPNASNIGQLWGFYGLGGIMAHIVIALQRLLEADFRIGYDWTNSKTYNFIFFVV